MTPSRKQWVSTITLLVVPALLVLGGLAVLRWAVLDGHATQQLALVTAGRPVPGGDNGYAWMALSDYEVPLAEVPEMMALEREHFDLLRQGVAPPVNPAQVKGASRDARGYTHFTAARFARRELYGGSAGGVCRSGDRGCLATLTAAPGPARARLASETGRLASVERALAASHWRDTFPASELAPLPPLQNLGIVREHIALDAIDGQPARAMMRACRLLDSVRRIGATTDMLVVKMVLQHDAVATADLLLDLRRAHPRTPLPDLCAEALRPVDPIDYSLCNVFRRDFLLLREAREHRRRNRGGSGGGLAAITAHLVENRELEEAWDAARHARICQPEFIAALESGGPMPEVAEPAPAPTLRDPSCYAALSSCSRARHDGLDAAVYQQRALGRAAQLRLLLAAHARLRGEDVGDRLAALDASGYPVAREEEDRRWRIVVPESRSTKRVSFSIDLSLSGNQPPR